MIPSATGVENATKPAETDLSPSTPMRRWPLNDPGLLSRIIWALWTFVSNNKQTKEWVPGQFAWLVKWCSNLKIHIELNKLGILWASISGFWKRQRLKRRWDYWWPSSLKYRSIGELPWRHNLHSIRSTIVQIERMKVEVERKVGINNSWLDFDE